MSELTFDYSKKPNSWIEYVEIFKQSKAKPPAAPPVNTHTPTINCETIVDTVEFTIDPENDSH